MILAGKDRNLKYVMLFHMHMPTKPTSFDSANTVQWEPARLSSLLGPTERAEKHISQVHVCPMHRTRPSPIHCQWEHHSPARVTAAWWLQPGCCAVWASDFPSQPNVLSVKLGWGSNRSSYVIGLGRLEIMHGKCSINRSCLLFPNVSGDGLCSCLSLTGTKLRAKMNKGDKWQWFREHRLREWESPEVCPGKGKSVHFVKGKKY